MFFTVTLAPVLFYLVAFLVCLAEVLGLRARDLSTLLARWRQFSRWTSTIPAALTLLFYLLAFTYGAFSGEAIPHPLTILTLARYVGRLALISCIACFASMLMVAAPVACERFLPSLCHPSEAPSGSGLGARLFFWNSRWSSWFLKLCSARLSIFVGSLAILASLILFYGP